MKIIMDIYIKENKNFNDITKILERKYKWIKPIDKKNFIFPKIKKNTNKNGINNKIIKYS